MVQGEGFPAALTLWRFHLIFGMRIGGAIGAIIGGLTGLRLALTRTEHRAPAVVSVAVHGWIISLSTADVGPTMTALLILAVVFLPAIGYGTGRLFAGAVGASSE